MGETERHKTIPDDERMSQLLGSLVRVDAPRDFEHRLKARIANARSPRTARRSNPILVFVVPASLLVLLGMFLYVNDLIVPSDERLKDVVVSDSVTNEAAAAEKSESPKVVHDADGLKEQTAAVAVPPIAEQARTATRPTQTRRSSSAREPETGSSIVLSATEPEKPILPPGIDPQRISPADRPPDFDRQGKPTLFEIFELLGVETDRAVSGVSVRSVRKNGIADRTGIRSGDSIEAIDDRPVNESTTFEDGSTLKTIRILRDGRQIVLPIKN